jgi:dihydrofolate reductase
MGWGIEFPYADKKNYVFTTQKGLENTEHVDFISENHIDFLRRLKQESGKDIWLVGGGKLNTMFLNENIIDEIQLFVMPIILPDGIELFEAIPNETKLKMLQTMSHSSGVVELIYKVEETQN